MKRTIIEILTAEIKLYEDGHQYVMDALQDYKVIVTLHQKHFCCCKTRILVKSREIITLAVWF